MRYRARSVPCQRDDLLHCDLVIALALILRMLEAQGGDDDVARVVLAEGGIAQEGAGIAVGMLAAEFLEDELALLQGAAVLLGHCEGLLLSHYFEDVGHVGYGFGVMDEGLYFDFICCQLIVNWK